MADSISPDVRFATGILENYNVNTVRLETNGATSAQAGQIATFNLPSATTVDVQSFCIHAKVQTTESTNSDGDKIYGKLPSDTSSLISQIQVFVAGIQVSSIQDFGTISRVKKLIESSRDRSASVDNTLYHGSVDDTAGVTELVDVLIKPRIGFFAETSTRVLPLAVLGDITIRVTFASNAVLCYAKGADTTGGAFDAEGVASASTCKYSVTQMHATINTLSMGPMYEAMVVERLSAGQPLSMHLKEYYNFNVAGQITGEQNIRFSLSSSSMDRMYTVCRGGNYLTEGIPSRKFNSANAGTESVIANYFTFSSFNGTRGYPGPPAQYNADRARLQNGNVRYNYEINAVKHPQYEATLLDAAHECLMISDQQGLGGRGWQAVGFQDWQDSKCVFPLQLCPPGTPIAIKAGYSSRGNNAHCVFSVRGQTPSPETDADKRAAMAVSESISSTLFVECTSEMKIMSAKEISMVY